MRLLIVLASSIFFISCGTTHTMKEVKRYKRAKQDKKACSLAKDVFNDSSVRRTRLDALRYRLNCLLKSGQFLRALNEIEQIENSEALVYYGCALISLDRFTQILSTKNRGKCFRYLSATSSLSRLSPTLDRIDALFAKAEKLWPEEAEISFRRALIFKLDAQAERAIAHIERALKLEKKAQFQVLYAHILLDLGYDGKAIDAVKEVLDYQPSLSDISLGRNLIQRYMKRRRKAISPNLQFELKEIEKAIDQERLSTALAKLSEMRADHPQIGLIYSLLGITHLRLSNQAQAVVALNKAIELADYDARNYFYLGILYSSRDKLKAIYKFRQALAKDPFMWRALLRLGQMLSNTGQKKEAAKVFERLTLLAPGKLAVRLSARSSFSAGNYKRALNLYRRILLKEPRDFESHLRSGQILAKLLKNKDSLEAIGDTKDKAKHHAMQAAAIRPTDPEVKALIDKLKQ